MSDVILELRGVRRSYQTGSQRLEVLKGVDLTLKRGEWCCLYGASGSGKTTLLNLIGLLETPEQGTITIDGKETEKFSRHRKALFRGEKIGFIFQSYHLLPELSIRENVRLAGTIGGLGAKEAGIRATELLKRVGLAERMRHRPNELSGGEQQRAAIARALVNTPALLLADEPTGNLDPKTGEEILELFSQLRRDDPVMTILMITHNPEIAKRATRTLQLRDGIVVCGATK